MAFLVVPLVTTAATATSLSCVPFTASMNNTNCPNMTRAKSGDVSPQACRSACCGASDCNAWSWHDVPGGQCHVSSTMLNPATDCHPNQRWTGESRGQPAPAPPAPLPKRDWNLQPRLLPPKGMWRGATIDNRFPPNAGESAITAFETAFGHRLHIYRGFKTESYYEISAEEKAFIAAGGILFYSIQPHPWSDWVDWHAAWKIKRFAEAIKAMAPAQVLVAPGYEPDGHANESQHKTNQVYGSAAEYRKMYRNFRHVFESENVTNAVFLLDLSCNVRNWEYVLPELYPGDDYVDWAFFNLFQSAPQAKVGKDGNCSQMAEELYAVLDNGVIGSTSKDIPWGVGAWGTMNQTFGDPAHGYPSKAIPAADRQLCLEQMMAVFEDRASYPKLKASIYFDSLNSMISPYTNSTFGSPELAPTLKRLLSLDVFMGNDT